MGRLLSCCACAASVAAGSLSFPLLPNATFGTWEGWGVSLAWWANVFGGGASAPVLADACFTLGNVSLPWLPGTVVPGLGMNIARYNAGASSNVSYQGQSIVYSPSIPWWKQIQAFWINWGSPDPASDSWDWSADAGQVNMLKLAAARCGARADCRLELFSNSPVWWQLDNHNPSGSDGGGSDNLQAWNRANHSYYMAAVAAHARDVWGVDFASIELFNEPIADWWKSSGTQEGCHFDASTQAAVLATLPDALSTFGLTGKIRVAASDESQVDMALSTWRAFDAGTRALVDQVNVHGYQEGGDRAGLYEATRGSWALRDSEYGDGDGSGATMAGSLFADWAALHPRGWCYWQTLDVSGGWALIGMDVDAASLGAVNTKYLVVAHFSRHIRPGATVLGTATDPRTSTAAAWDPTTGVLTLVVGNLSPAAANVTIDLTAFAAAPAGPVRGQWLTSVASATPDPAAAYTRVYGAAVDASKLLALSLPAHSISTVEVAGVAL